MRSSIRVRSPLSGKTSYNPLLRSSIDGFTSFDASQFILQDPNSAQYKNKRKFNIHRTTLRRHNSHFDEGIITYKDESINYVDSTPNSTGSRNSIRHQEYEAREFLERYSLPRVVSIDDSEPFLLYRCIDSFTKVEARCVSKKSKDKSPENTLHFPEGYPGWFSLRNENGEKSAVVYSSILQLVREQVCSFISVQPFTAYACQTSEIADGSERVQYLKTQVHGGQHFQLRAVFQHKEGTYGGSKKSTRTSRMSRSIRDKDLSNRYAQLINQNNQELYAPLTAKGEFYETHSSLKARLCFPGMLDKTGPLALDKDCLYKLTHLVRRISVPITVKLISGPLPHKMPKDCSDTFILEKKFQEPLMVTCSLPPPNSNISHEISCINLNSKVKLVRNTLGFDSENCLFKSQRLQAALTHCHKNVESWYREVRLVPNMKHEQEEKILAKIKNGNTVKCNTEDDINIASNSDYVNEKQLITASVVEKFPKSKKWFRHFKLLNRQSKLDRSESLPATEKSKSIERYKDMSKLIEEKFGKRNSNPVKKSASFMFSTKRIDLEETETNSSSLLKCQSLDTQLYTINEMKQKDSDTNLSVLSYDFQMCILENENGSTDKGSERNFRQQSASKCSERNSIKLKQVDNFSSPKNKPDLIPTLPKQELSLITDRLCSEFHVKTKVQNKKNVVGRFARKLAQFDGPPLNPVVVEIHENEQPVKKKYSKLKRATNEEIPYSHVADEICGEHKNALSKDENIYAEISETPILCKCSCKLNSGIDRQSDYLYVKLGSNGDSGVQSGSDEAIYNTLR